MRLGQVYCSIAVLFVLLALLFGSRAACAMPLALGGQVTMYTSMPPPRRITRELMADAGRRAAREVWRGGPGATPGAVVWWGDGRTGAGLAWAAGRGQGPPGDSVHVRGAR